MFEKLKKFRDGFISYCKENRSDILSYAIICSGAFTFGACAGAWVFNEGFEAGEQETIDATNMLLEAGTLKWGDDYPMKNAKFLQLSTDGYEAADFDAVLAAVVEEDADVQKDAG